jgi:hypothetical protein
MDSIMCSSVGVCLARLRALTNKGALHRAPARMGIPVPDGGLVVHRTDLRLADRQPVTKFPKFNRKQGS